MLTLHRDSQGHRHSPSEVRNAVRALNWLLAVPGMPKGDLSFSAIVEKAERSTGLRDWGDNSYLERLRFSIDAATETSDLSAIGRVGVPIVYHWHAANRLRIVEHVKRHPEVLDVPIERPIFILGWFRTATTSLHNLMSLDPAFRVPQSWELCYPVPEGRDPLRDERARIRRTANKWRLAHFLAPGQKYAHDLRPKSPEECFFMLANSGLFLQQIMAQQGYGYAWSLLKQNVAPAYQDLRVQYQILASQRPQRQWVMKCPLHLWFLDDLLHAFPDARIIHTHRPAAQAIPSLCSMSAIMSRPLTRDFQFERHGEFFTEFCRAGIDRAMRVRSCIPTGQIYDVLLSDLDRDPVSTVQGIYRHFDLPCDEDGVEARILDFLQAQRRPKPSSGRRHVYSAEQFGLTADGLSKEFADYEALFGID
jgi:hypothetical protein